ncbi:MAG: YdcF family protein [Agriterribacter sp.]
MMKHSFQTLIYSFVLIILFSCMACSFSKKTSSAMLKKAQAAGPFDVVIVPGIKFEDGKWDRTMKGRIYWAKYLFDKGIAKNIMFSGNAVYTPYYEAEIMALYAEALGIPKQNIYLEKKAEHSTENVYYSYKKAKLEGFKTIAMASDPFQSKLLRAYSRRKVSSDIVIIPMVIDTMKVLEKTMIDPEINFSKAFKENFVSIKDRESIWRRMRGTIRGNADTTAYQDASSLRE